MNAFDRKLLEIIQQHDPDAKSNEIQKWSESASVWASRNYRHAALWIDRTFQYLDKDLNDVDVEKFIINAYGIIVDLSEFLEKKAGIVGLLGFQSILEFRRYVIRELRDRGMQLHLLRLLEVQDALSDFIEKFSTEEIFATTFFRNSYCHPTLSAYSVKLSKKKGGLVKFDPEKYEAFLKIQPYAELDLCKNLFDKFTHHRTNLSKIRDLLWQLQS